MKQFRFGMSINIIARECRESCDSCEEEAPFGIIYPSKIDHWR